MRLGSCSRQKDRISKPEQNTRGGRDKKQELHTNGISYWLLSQALYNSNLPS